jgi:hypothetical protein
MKLNVARKVKHYRLAKTKAYYAIIEAVSNSIDSYRTTKQPVEISIEFFRDNTGLDFRENSQETKLYKKINIIDKGIGFDNDNYNSFNTSDSDYKESYGGKGLGRFSWLKVFESVTIESVYKENDKYYLRKFGFARTESGIENESKKETSKKETGTVVSLISQKKSWEIPKRLSTFCERLIECFLPLFTQKKQPKIILIDKDNNEILNVNDYFSQNYKGEIGSVSFELRKQKFDLSVHKTNIGNINQLILFAHNRASKTIDMAKHIIDLNTTLSDIIGEYHIVAFLKGNYLDGIVSPERDDFDFDSDEADIDLQEITEKSFQEIKVLIKDILENVYKIKKEVVNSFISNEGPEYRYLVSEKPEILNSITPNATKNEIENQLHSAEISYKEETRKEILNIISKDKIDTTEIDRVYSKVSEAAKAELTKYVLWRDHVIKLLNKKINSDSEQFYNDEDELHKLFYQMRVTSEDVPYESNNLWLIDERLNFHDYLASDLPHDGKKGDRPDIIAYNIANYFNDSDNPNNSFSIVEFKKPMRNDYNDKVNPIDQVTDYIEKIRNNKEKTMNGQFITVATSAPCFAYIICSLTTKMRALCEKRDYKKTYDNMGYFRYNENLNSYFEVISFEKIVKDANNRNRIFMKKLGLK